MEFIVRFTFTHPGMATNIVGTIGPTASRKGPLPPALYAEAKRWLATAGSAHSE